MIITDCEKVNPALQNMIARFQAVLFCKSRVVNIREYPFRGGCLGCFNCAVSGKCIYTDGFDDFLRNDIQTGDAMAAKLEYAIENKPVQPRNFFGVGGMKISRDLIYLMQGMMTADHKFFKAHNQYDFPQKEGNVDYGVSGRSAAFQSKAEEQDRESDERRNDCTV